MAWTIISKIILFWYASASWQGFSICFPIAACKQSLVSPYRGVAWTRNEHMLPPPPSSFHLTTQPVSSIPHLVKVAERPRLSEFQQVFLSSKGGELYVRTCKSFLNMKSLKRSSWIRSAWELLPIPSLNRQKCSKAKWPPVCQKSRSPSGPGACDKS